jgi:hypothetical protein
MAFSSGAYASISNSLNQCSHFSKAKELKEDITSSSSDNSVFEETENDSEESVNPSELILPDHFSFNSITAFTCTDFVTVILTEKTVSPLFLSFRTLRI